MHSFKSLTSVVVALLACHASALPNALPTYSVVDVDGGANGHNLNGSPVPTTVYKTITEAAPKVTVTVTATATPSTIISSTLSTTTLTESVTLTVYAEHTVSVSASPETTSSAFSAIVSSSTIAYHGAPVESWTPASAISTAVTSTATSPSLKPYSSAATYDDGLWHTSYAIKPSVTGAPTIPAYDVSSITILASGVPSSSSAQPVASSSGTVYRRQAKRLR